MKKLVYAMLSLLMLVVSVYASDKTKGKIHPDSAVLRITLTQQPIHNNFTRFMVFEDYDGNSNSVAFDFTKKSDLVYEAVVNSTKPTQLDKLGMMCDTDNRGYWDRMRLVNSEGTTLLSIGHIFFKVYYDGGAGIRNIPILDWEINRVLKEGSSKIYLNPYARYSRIKWAEEEIKNYTGNDFKISAQMPPAFLAAVNDIGKCGTSGNDEYTYNPKYKGDTSNLCSEFVSWYYANEGVSFGKQVFRDIGGHKTFIDVFEDNDRRYEYDVSTKEFKHSVTGEVYIPRAGDYLRRDDLPNPDKDGHSMMIADWDHVNGIAVVINGPWPVTVRKVDVDKKVNDGDTEFQVGRVNEIVTKSAEDYIHVYFKDEGIHEDNIVKPRIYMENTSEEILTDIVLYYDIIVPSGKNVVLETYYTPFASVSIENVSDTEYRIRYDFSGISLAPGDIVPNNSGNSIGLHYGDWSTWDKSDDPSYIGTSVFVHNEKIEVSIE